MNNSLNNDFNTSTPLTSACEYTSGVDPERSRRVNADLSPFNIDSTSEEIPEVE